MQSPRFTPQSARAALESLRGTALAIAHAFRILEATRPASIREDSPVGREYFQLVSLLRATLDALERKGIVVRDPRRGCLDFPARRAGRPVVLCWTLGEPGLAFWRDANEDDEAARPLDDGPWE